LAVEAGLAMGQDDTRETWDRRKGRGGAGDPERV